MAEITYPTTINTDYEKLCAVYSLIEQMRLEHNKLGAIAEANPEKYRDRWYLFARRPQNLGGNIFNKKLLPLLQEQNRLRAAIREKRFTNKEWKALSDEARDVARLEMYSDKTLERVKPTKATSILLDELKGVSLDNLTGEVPPDPTEDFTEFTEVDSGGDITITASKMDVDTMPKGANSYTYKSYGAGHFGDFDHLLDVYTGNEDTGAWGNYAGCWAVVDTPGTKADAEYTHNEGIYLFVLRPDASRKFTLVDYSNDEDDSGGISVNTKYYLTISRSSTTATCLIYTDSGRTNLHDTLSITCGITAYEYAQGVCSQEQSGNNEASYYIENLDLQEGGGVTEKESADSGSGLESKSSDNPVVTLSKSETGSGAESKGSGNPQATLMKSETGSGVDALTSLLAELLRVETGSGVEVSSLDITGYVSKAGSDSGNGSETGAVIAALIRGFETGSGIEVITDRALMLAESAVGVESSITVVVWTAIDGGSGVEVSNVIPSFFSGDAGFGYELSMAIKDIRGRDGGVSSDALRALIGTVHSGYDMRLYGRSGRVKTPSRGVRMPSKGVNI